MMSVVDIVCVPAALYRRITVNSIYVKNETPYISLFVLKNVRSYLQRSAVIGHDRALEFFRIVGLYCYETQRSKSRRALIWRMERSRELIAMMSVGLCVLLVIWFREANY